MKKIIVLAMAIVLTCPFLAFSQNNVDNMAMAMLSEKMDKLGIEMEGLGKVMESYGKEMEKYGKELEKSPGNAPKAEKKMEELGDKMHDLGEEMGKLGDQMGQYGEKMGKLHQEMIDWFFCELKKDALIPSLNGKARIIFDEKGLGVSRAQGTLPAVSSRPKKHAYFPPLVFGLPAGYKRSVRLLHRTAHRTFLRKNAEKGDRHFPRLRPILYRLYAARCRNGPHPLRRKRRASFHPGLLCEDPDAGDLPEGVGGFGAEIALLPRTRR